MIDAVRLMIDDDPHLTYQQIDFSLWINSPVIYSILHDHLKVRKICARWVKHLLINDQKRIRIQFKTIRTTTMSTCFWHCHWWSIMIVSSLWSWKQTGSDKRLVWKDDRPPAKVLGNEWSRFSSRRSELIESIPLESRVSINVRTVCLGSLMLLDRDDKRQESVCWFCMMTIEEPIGLEPTTEYLAENRVESYENCPWDLFLFQKVKHHLRWIEFNKDE